MTDEMYVDKVAALQEVVTGIAILRQPVKSDY
jgi:hypothetical protein